MMHEMMRRVMIVSCFMMVGGLVGLLDVSVGLHVLRAACMVVC